MKSKQSKNSKRSNVLVVAILAATVAATFGSAAPPIDVLNYQGVLRDSAGSPLDGDYDMIFRFYNSGSEIFVDEHTAEDVGPIAVRGGLFNVDLGAGTGGDGSGVFPNDPYTSLSQVFADFTQVRLEIEIDGEVLSPRILILSAAYALNAGSLDGVPETGFLRADEDDTSSGTLRANMLESNTNIHLNTDEAADPTLIFSTGAAPGNTASLMYSTTDFRFEFDSSVKTRGSLFNGGNRLYMNYDCVTGCGSTIYFNYFGDQTAEHFKWDVFNFELTDDLWIYGGNLRTGDIFVNWQNDDPFGDGHIYFYNDVGGVNGESLYWDNSADAFYVTDGFIATGELHTQATQIVLRTAGPNANQDIEFYNNGTQTERFQWDNGAQRFEVSDDFHVFGSLTADVKNFVQNHPHRDDLEIVYTSLEGNEVTTFTRGSGRLVGGEARIELEESFRFVTNPDIGLSVHLTPRGGWSELYAESISTTELVVRSNDGSDVPFDFVVYGLRIGYEEHPVYRAKRAEAFAPPPGHFAAELAVAPELAEHTALHRYEKMNGDAFGKSNDERVAAHALREAIGTRELNLDYPRGSDLSVREMNRIALENPVDASGDLEIVPEIAQPVRPEEPRSIEESPKRTGLPITGEFGLERDAEGNVYAPSFRPSAGDIASLVPVGEAVEAGDVLVIDTHTPGRMLLGRMEADTAVFGIVAADPGVVLGSQGPTSDEDGSPLPDAPVAVTGVVLCKVDASWGAIRPGDLLQTSPTPGHAMRAAEPQLGSVLGKALEPLDAGTGLIRVLVTLR